MRAIISLVIIGGITTFGLGYGLSYQSARGFTVEIVQASRTYTWGPFASIQFDVTAHVWSSNSLDTSIDQVQFYLTVDTISISTVSARGSTFGRNSYLEYNLRFITANAQDATLLGEKNSHRLTLSVATLVQAGLYSSSASPSTSRTVNIHRVADATISPTVVNECQTITQDILLTQRGGVIITLSSSPDTLQVWIRDSDGTTVFNEERTSFNSAYHLPADNYNLQITNTGFFCTGADNQVSGSVEFWHETTVLATQ